MPEQWNEIKSDLDGLEAEVKRLAKCLNKSTLPQNYQQTLQQFVNAFNNFSIYIEQKYSTVPLESNQKQIFSKVFTEVRDRCLRVFGRHKWTYHIPNYYGGSIDLEVENESEPDTDDEMAITKDQLITLASAIIGAQYDGNPSGLRAFLDKLNQIKDVMEAEELTAVNFVKGRLTDSARDCVSDEDVTIDQIIEKLKGSVKLPSTAELEAKLQATSPYRKERNSYLKEIEDIANLLKRAYISDGLNNTKAEQYASRELKKSLIANSMDKDLHTSLRDRTLEKISEVTAAYCEVKQTQERVNMVRRVQDTRGRGYHRGRGNNYNNRNNNNNGNNDYNNRNNNNDNGNNNYNNRNGGHARHMGNGSGPSEDGTNLS